MPDRARPAVNLADARRAGKGAQIMLPLQGEEHSSVLSFSGERVVVNNGFRADRRSASDSAGATH
jgi:hypothetical protein